MPDGREYATGFDLSVIKYPNFASVREREKSHMAQVEEGGGVHQRHPVGGGNGGRGQDNDNVSVFVEKGTTWGGIPSFQSGTPTLRVDVDEQRERSQRRRRRVILICTLGLLASVFILGSSWTIRKWIYQEVTERDAKGGLVRHVFPLLKQPAAVNIEEDKAFSSWIRSQTRFPIDQGHLERGWIPVSVWRSKGGSGQDGQQWNVSLSALEARLRGGCPLREGCVCMSSVELGILSNLIYLAESDEVLYEPTIVDKSTTLIPVRYEFGDEFTSKEKLKNIDYWRKVPEWILVEYRRSLLDRRRFSMEQAACIVAGVNTVTLAAADVPSVGS